MNKIKIIFLMTIIIILTGLSGFGVAMALPLTQVDSEFSLSENIFIDSLDLSTNKIIIKSGQKAEDFKISGDCNLFGEILKSDGYTHIYNLRLLEKDCELEKIDVYLKSKFSIVKKTFNLIKPFDLYNKYLDYSTKDLEKILNSTISVIDSYDINSINNSEQKVKTYRRLEELKYLKNFFENILKNRKNKYSIPVKGNLLPTRETKLPNSVRPYRSSYTNGIHQGWDFDAKKLTSVISLDDSIVIRVVDGFKTSDFSKLKRNKNLTNDEKLLNLDILRGNQVWIKTSKGEIAFYSHLETINPDIKVGKVLKKGQEIGKIGATGVPEEGYSDFHLHIEIYQNPYNSLKAGEYSFLEIMNWDWLFKGEKAKYILENQKNIFE